MSTPTRGILLGLHFLVHGQSCRAPKVHHHDRGHSANILLLLPDCALPRGNGSGDKQVGVCRQPRPLVL